MRYIALIFMVLWTAVAQTAVQASVRPLTVQEGQSVELVISSDTPQTTAPDWMPLTKDFEMGGHMYAEQTNIINGRTSTRFQYIVPLTPLRSGEIEIPALTWGNETTQPLVLSVQPTDSKEAQMFMTGETDRQQAYVGQGITYTVRVYDKAGMSSGEFIPPEIEGGEVQKIGSPVTSSATKDGKWFQVYEQKYVVFAPKPGPLTITPARFTGYVQDKQNNRDLLSVFGMPDDVFYRGFINQQPRRISLKAEPVTLEILPEPTTYHGWWLPATDVQLQQKMVPEKPIAQAGESISRQISLTAQGVLPHQLPDVSMPDAPGFRVYPGEAQKTLSYNAQGLVSMLEKTFVLVPVQNGEHTLPPISVPWFDVNTQQPQTASLPSYTVVVQGVAQLAEETKEVPPVIVQEPSAFAQENSLLWFFGGLCVGLMVSAGAGLIALYIIRRRKNRRLPDMYPY